MPDDADIIAGLLRELEGYERAGDKENIRGVKLELDRLGYKAAAPAKRAEKPAVRKETRDPKQAPKKATR